MKIILNLNLRGTEEKISQKGKPYLTVNTEDKETGEPLRFYCLKQDSFNEFKKLKRGEDYDFIFDIWSNSLSLVGVQVGNN